MKVYAFVPAKGTSERVENKNMRFLDGERLFIRALKTLLKCKEIDRVFLDTESEEMYKLADYLPITFMKRDASLANNKTDGHKMFMNEVNSFPEADIYVQLLCTSPFIHPKTIDNAIKELKNNSEYDSAILMKKDKYYFWKDGRPTYDISHIPNSKDLSETIIESMGLYIHKKESALKLNRRYGNNPLLVYGNLEELIDVNTPEDLQFAEVYAKGKRNEENKKLRLIKHFVSSPALSDLLDDMKLEKGKVCGAVLNKFVCNLTGCKLLGRANTLKLRKLNENEDFRGIYGALSSYEGIAENDIIIVENEVGDYAYFGDLNTRLAIQSGASGAIINGATRDKNATKELNFPVFAKGYNATDVRRRATLEYINKPIKIDGVIINPGDLIFADECAVVVIYQKYEDEVISRVLDIFKNEKDIVNDILQKKHIKRIIEERGNF
ncbi:MAG: cytidyltransferase [Alphaproteobacteria bacterium]|nr:cytidyltransferase [Alphaproteobacteria bacterium]